MAESSSKENGNAKEGIYLYGIIRSDNNLKVKAEAIGPNGNEVYGIQYKDLCAVVSNTSIMRYEARRRYMMAHQLVLEEIMQDHTVLPIRFSTISSGPEKSKVEQILEKEYDKFSDLLNRMDGKKELGLKVIAQEKPIYAHILGKYDDIRALKEKLARLDPEKAHYQLMKIGEMVEKALIKENTQFKDIIMNALTPIAKDVKINDNYGERMLLNAAFLINSSDEERFDKAIEELDKEHGELLTFKYVGNLPPYNFVNLVIKLQEE